MSWLPGLSTIRLEPDPVLHTRNPPHHLTRRFLPDLPVGFPVHLSARLPQAGMTSPFRGATAHHPHTILADLPVHVPAGHPVRGTRAHGEALGQRRCQQRRGPVIVAQVLDRQTVGSVLRKMMRPRGERKPSTGVDGAETEVGKRKTTRGYRRLASGRRCGGDRAGTIREGRSRGERGSSTKRASISPRRRHPRYVA